MKTFKSTFIKKMSFIKNIYKNIPPSLSLYPFFWVKLNPKYYKIIKKWLAKKCMPFIKLILRRLVLRHLDLKNNGH